MKVLMLVPKLNDTGVINVVKNICSGAISRNLDIVIVALSSKKKEQNVLSFFESNNVKFRFVSNSSENFTPFYLTRLNKIIRQECPDVIHSHSLKADLFCQFIITAIPKVSTIHCDGSAEFVENYGFFRGGALAWFQRLLAKKFKRVYVVSDGISEYLSKYGIDSLVVRNGIAGNNNEVYRAGDNGDGKKFITATLINKRKNVEHLLKYFTKHPELNLEVLGEGPLLDPLKLKYDTENIVFRGHVKNPKSYIANADVYISASKTEGLSISTLEAMSLNKKLILSDIPGHRTLDQPQAGGKSIYFFDIKKINSLEMAVNEYLQRQKEDSNTKSIFFNDFSNEKMAELYCDYYNQIC